MLSTAHLTTQLVLTCTGLLLVMDVILAVMAQRRIHREQFRRMRRPMVILSGIFFLLIWMSAMLWAWDWFYSYIFPGWARSVLPALFGIGYGLLAAGMAWLCLKLPGSPALIWCLLGGLEGLLSHIYAIYGLGAASRPPIMHGSDQLAVLVFAIFEKAFYWSLILFASRLLAGVKNSIIEIPKAGRELF